MIFAFSLQEKVFTLKCFAIKLVLGDLRLLVVSLMNFYLQLKTVVQSFLQFVGYLEILQFVAMRLIQWVELKNEWSSSFAIAVVMY